MVCMRRKILSIQNIACETLGALEEPLRSEGYELYEIQAPSDQIQKVLTNLTRLLFSADPCPYMKG